MSIWKDGNTYRAEIFLDGKRIFAKCGFANKSFLARKWHNEQKVKFQNMPYGYDTKTEELSSLDSPQVRKRLR